MKIHKQWGNFNCEFGSIKYINLEKYIGVVFHYIDDHNSIGINIYLYSVFFSFYWMEKK